MRRVRGFLRGVGGRVAALVRQRASLKIGATVGVVVLAMATPARADVRTYVIAIGNNRPPAHSTEDPRALQYADDDAADFFTFARGMSTDGALLTVLDADSQRRFPGLAAEAKAPTLVELRRVVSAYRARFDDDRRRGDDPVLLLFFSGHGSRDPGEPAALAMLDGPLTQGILYDEVLAALPARFVHVLIDACHAEAVVRPRDASAQSVAVSDEDVRGLAAKTTLDRFPHVGAFVAAASAAQTHEWDVYQRGVFTHELLSGLRGAADVNGDGRIEYSELSAFIAAANRGVADVRARPQIVARPPALDRRAPIVDLNQMRKSVRIVGNAGALGELWVEDSLGNRLVDVHAEADFRVSLTLPASERLYLRTRHGEAELSLATGTRTAFDALALHAPTTSARGAIDTALRRGIFASPFGPVYYRGFVDSHPLDYLAVPIDASPTPLEASAARAPTWPGWAAGSLGAASGVAAGVFAILALNAQSDLDAARFERPATLAKERFVTDRNIAIGLGAVAVVGLTVGTVLLLKSAK